MDRLEARVSPIGGDLEVLDSQPQGKRPAERRRTGSSIAPPAIEVTAASGQRLVAGLLDRRGGESGSSPGPLVAGAVDLGGVGDPEDRDGPPTEADAGGELPGQVDQADGLGAVLGPELDRPER
jgi:hypothetical protein